MQVIKELEERNRALSENLSDVTSQNMAATQSMIDQEYRDRVNDSDVQSFPEDIWPPQQDE